MKPVASLPLKIPAHGRAGALAVLATLLCCGPLLSAEKERFLTGQLLVATEEMKDPRFAESVIYMVNHDAQGASGLIVNRPVAKGPFEDVLKGTGAGTKGAKGEITIHYGGPVGTRQGFMLHSDDVLVLK